MKSIAILGIIVSVFALSRAQDKKPEAPPAPAIQRNVAYATTEVELLKLQVAQKDALLAQIQYQTAVGNFNAQVKAIHDAHGWPDSVTFHFDTLKFSGPPGAEKPAPAPNPGTPAPNLGTPGTPTGPPVEPAKAK
jgi:hypothetical protein